ncbi:hypothetical protein WICPIJ_006033 [Wickerhamomyces pijperi]|uniref:Uncharacterized protein n=1 Tax=Wickerhamomyces pijperi TaxID=599730 RepID=A0A9P8TKK1_WICPI|nr:hypothetical protein WICPIJ_006033 [Wickerhamomyces pijperi]
MLSGIAIDLRIAWFKNLLSGLLLMLDLWLTDKLEWTGHSKRQEIELVDGNDEDIIAAESAADFPVDNDSLSAVVAAVGVGSFPGEAALDPYVEALEQS